MPRRENQPSIKEPRQSKNFVVLREKFPLINSIKGFRRRIYNLSATTYNEKGAVKKHPKALPRQHNKSVQSLKGP